MLNRQEKVLMFVNSMISIAFAIAIVIPWGTVSLSKVEVILKIWILPLIALILFVINIGSKYRNYRPANRYTTVNSYMPIFTILSALLFNTLLLLVRSSVDYSNTSWLVITLIVSVLFIAITLLSHFFYRAVVIFSKNEMMLIDAPIVLLFLGSLFFVNSIALKYQNFGEPFANGTIAFIIATAVFAAIVATFHVLSIIRLFKQNPEFQVESKKKLIQEFLAFHKKEYDKAEQVILQKLFTFSKDQLGLKGLNSEEIDKLKAEKAALEAEIERLQNESEIAEGVNREKLFALQERLAQLQIVLAEVQVQYAAQQRLLDEQKAEFEKARNEVVVPTPVQVVEVEKVPEVVELDEETKKQLEELEAFKAEQAEKEAARALAEKNKKPKKFKPSYEKMVNYATSLPDKEIKVVPNAKGTQHKFYLGKKLFLVTMATNSDYRITFCSEAEPAFNLIVDYPNIVTKATSPKGDEWFRIVNKGEQDEKLLKTIIKNSVKYIEDQEALKLKAIEEEKARKLAEKEAAKAAAKAARDAAKAAKKAEEQAA